MDDGIESAVAWSPDRSVIGWAQTRRYNPPGLDRLRGANVGNAAGLARRLLRGAGVVLLFTGVAQVAARLKEIWTAGRGHGFGHLRLFFKKQ